MSAVDRKPDAYDRRADRRSGVGYFLHTPGDDLERLPSGRDAAALRDFVHWRRNLGVDLQLPRRGVIGSYDLQRIAVE